jgi:hypothetical protein
MRTTATARTPNAAGIAGTTAAAFPRPRPDLSPPLQLRERARHRACGIAMRDAMRHIVWITGVAFGIPPREAFSRSAPVSGASSRPRQLQALASSGAVRASARSNSPKDQA